MRVYKAYSDMRTSFNIPEPLLRDAKKASNAKTMTQAIIVALTEMIQRRKSREILKLKGSLSEDYDYKAGRRKR
jgi:Bacterial antitoxin of type II TA system, VapB